MPSESPRSVSFDSRHADTCGGELVLDAETFSALEELAGDDDPDLVSDLIQLFVDDATERVGAIQQSKASKDYETIGRAAHALKSSSANLGALSFSRACAALEAMSRSSEEIPIDTFESLVDQICDMYADVRTAFSQAESAA